VYCFDHSAQTPFAVVRIHYYHNSNSKSAFPNHLFFSTVTTPTPLANATVIKAFEQRTRDSQMNIAAEIFDTTTAEGEIPFHLLLTNKLGKSLPIDLINKFIRYYGSYNKPDYLDWDQVMDRIVDNIDKMQVTPTVTTINCIVGAYARKERPKNAVTLVTSNSSPIIPGTKSCSL
jgi:hypothetical protein